MTALRIEALRTLRAVAPLRERMDALNLVSRRPCPFSTFEYAEAFVQNDEYGTSDAEVLFLVAYDGAELVGYLPLRKHRVRSMGLPYRRIDVLVSHDTDRPHVVARADVEARCAEAFYAYVLDRERGWSALELAMQDADSPLSTLPASRRRLLVRKSDTMPNTTIPLEYPSFRDYFQTVAQGQRKNMGRLCRRLLGAGRVEVVSSSDPRARSSLFERYLDLESRSWKEAAHAGIRRDPRRVAFFRALCAPEQPMRIGFDFVVLDDLPISALVSGTFAGTAHGLETCFDREYDDLGPGHLLTLMAIRRAMDEGSRAFNFNGNYAYYKSRMGGVVTKTSAVQIYKVGSLPWLRAVAGDAKRRLRPAADEHDRFNPQRRRVSDVAEEGASARHEVPARSPRVEERERFRGALRALEADGVSLQRTAGAELDRALPFNARRKEAA